MNVCGMLENVIVCMLGKLYLIGLSGVEITPGHFSSVRRTVRRM